MVSDSAVTASMKIRSVFPLPFGLAVSMSPVNSARNQGSLVTLPSVNQLLRIEADSVWGLIFRISFSRQYQIIPDALL